jgi:hypothetical protein
MARHVCCQAAERTSILSFARVAKVSSVSSETLLIFPSSQIVVAWPRDAQRARSARLRRVPATDFVVDRDHDTGSHGDRGRLFWTSLKGGHACRRFELSSFPSSSKLSQARGGKVEIALRCFCGFLWNACSSRMASARVAM